MAYDIYNILKNVKNLKIKAIYRKFLSREYLGVSNLTVSENYVSNLKIASDKEGNAFHLNN